MNTCWRDRADRVRRPALSIHRCFDQRVVMRHRFGGLERDEAGPRPAHRPRSAGCRRELFEPAAVEAVCQASRGAPRPRGRIAHYARPAAALDQAATVSREHVERATPEARAQSPVRHRAA